MPGGPERTASRKMGAAASGWQFDGMNLFGAPAAGNGGLSSRGAEVAHPVHHAVRGDEVAFPFHGQKSQLGSQSACHFSVREP